MVSWALVGPPPPPLTSRLAVVITGRKLTQVQLNDLACTHTESTACRVDVYVKISNETPTRSALLYIRVCGDSSG